MFGLLLAGPGGNVLAPSGRAGDAAPLSPQAVLDGKYVGQATLEFAIDKAGQLFEARSIKPGESDALYLAPKADGGHGSRVYVIISWGVATRLLQLGVDDPTEHFRGKMIRVSGSVRRLAGDDLPKSRSLYWSTGKYRSETVSSGTEPEYAIEVTSLDQLKLVRKP